MSYELVGLPILKVLGAILLGGLIGLERELAAKPAGLRTHMLVAGAASLMVLWGDVMIRMYSTESPDSALIRAIQADPIRIMEAIITGISFLGAGTIIFKNQKESVEGLTTAASILFAAAIGIGVALNQYLLSIILTFVVIIILFSLSYIEKFIKKLRHWTSYDKKNR
jgi:putative Mg2+ transporter-C (MgtC) family protein